MIVFITKYALTSGIIEMEAEIKDCDWSKKKTSAWGKIEGGYPTGFYNNDFHLTKEEAEVDVKQRIDKKIESLKKQIKKLENLKTLKM